MKFAKKRIRQYPSHLMHCYCTTLVNESHFLQIFSRYERKRKRILIFSVLKIRSLSPYRLKIKFSMSLFFFLFTVVINLWHMKFVTADVIAVSVNKQHGIQRRKQDFDKKFVFKKVHSKEVDIRKSWTKHGVNKAVEKVVEHRHS